MFLRVFDLAKQTPKQTSEADPETSLRNTPLSATSWGGRSTENTTWLHAHVNAHAHFVPLNPRWRYFRMGSGAAFGSFPGCAVWWLLWWRCCRRFGVLAEVVTPFFYIDSYTVRIDLLNWFMRYAVAGWLQSFQFGLEPQRCLRIRILFLYSAFSKVNLVDRTDFSLSVVAWSRWIRLVGLCMFYNFIARCGLSLEIMVFSSHVPPFLRGRMVRLSIFHHFRNKNWISYAQSNGLGWHRTLRVVFLMPS